MLKQIALATRSNEARDGIEGAARLVNCYAEKIGSDGKAGTVVYPIDGWRQWGTVSTTTGGGRAFLALDTSLVSVMGRIVVQWDSSGAPTILGGFETDGIVSIARNRRGVPQVAICCNGQVAVVSGGVLSHITDPDLPPPTSIDCLDGYLLALLPDGRIFASALDDVTSWDALSFAKAEANPDGGVRVKVLRNYALFYGTRTTEWWTDNGGDPFPLGRDTTVNIGCLAGGSVADFEQTHAFVAHDGTVRIWDGYTPKRISSHSVERLIDGETDPTRITALAWTSGGHSFYALTGTDWTKVYDARTGDWHDRESYGFDGRWRASAAVEFVGKRLFGSWEDGTIYEASRDFHDEAGNPIVMTMQAPPVHAWPNRLRWNTLYVDALPGVGVNTPTAQQNASPSIMLDWSDDGGRTWSAQRMVAVGEQGQRRTRIATRRLGVAPAAGRTFRVSMSAAVSRGLAGMAGDVDLVPVA